MMRDKLLAQAIVRLMAGDNVKYMELAKRAMGLDGHDMHLMASIEDIIQAKGDIA